MLFAAMLVGSNHAALEDRKRAFNRVRVRLATHVFARGMGDNAVRLERATWRGEVRGFVSHEVRSGIGIAVKNFRRRLAVHAVLDMERNHLAAALYQRDNRV